MNLEQAKALQQHSQVQNIELMRNPENRSEWFVTLRTLAGKSFMLVDERDQVISETDINQLLEQLKSIGIKQVQLHL